ncbi:MAG: CbrC family protein [Intestinibacter sp.]|uniref:CbrC family protein n=1 Tax=Intestinibacter sp. TaxID=1965304 RepID=UPI002A7F903B|nr:CbrC family protein [Intestinibacter sp.]MDY4573420.1 CbrC family protein [Intestinibacter sp.]
MKELKFKYFPNAIKEVFTTGDTQICDCCGEETDIYYEGPFYSEEEIEVLCPKCIASGRAAEELEGQFIDDACVDEIEDEEKLEELIYKTPSYTAEQEAYWLAHCDDYCAFMGEVTWEEIQNMGIEYVLDELEEYDPEEVKEALDGESDMAGYLFKCLHCDKYRLHIEIE